MAKTVVEIMNRELLSVRPQERADTVRDALVTFGVSAVPVVDDERHPIGFLSARDLLRDARPRPSAPVVTIASGATVRDAARVMGESGHHQLVVVDDHRRAIGMVSTLDVVRALIGLPTAHPAAFPHADGSRGVAWTDDAVLAEESIAAAPDGPGILLLVQGGEGVREGIVWVEPCENVRQRLDDMLSLPQSDARLARVLLRPGLRFRAAHVPQASRRAEIAGEIADALAHAPPPQARAIVPEPTAARAVKE